MEKMKDQNQHRENEQSTAEQKRENMDPATDTTIKKDGVTSAFSAATSYDKNETPADDTDMKREGAKAQDDTDAL